MTESFEVGSAHVDIDADVEKTIREVVRDLQASQAAFTAQGTKLGDALGGGIQRGVDAKNITAAVDGNLRKANAKLAELAARDIAIDADVDAKLDKFNLKIAEAEAKHHRTGVDVEPELASYRAAMALEEAKRYRAHVDVDVDRDKLGAVVSGLTQIGSTAMQAGSQAAGALGDAAGGGMRLAGALGAAGGTAYALVAVTAGFGVIAPALIVAANAAISLSGALGTIPGMLAAGGATFATFKIGTTGVSEALDALGKSHTAAGGAAGGDASAQRAAANAIAGAQKSLSRAVEDAASSRVQAAARTRTAEESLSRTYQDTARANADAARRTKEAEDNLTDARRDARQAMADLNREVRRGSLDQRQATLDITEAQEELNRTFADPTANARRREQAQLNLDKAVASLDDMIARNQELGTAQADSARAGVEGSTQVRSAQKQLGLAQEEQANTARDSQRRTADATKAVFDAHQAQALAQVQSARQIADAQDQLRQAQEKTGSSGVKAANDVAAALAALSPAARDFVKAIDEQRDAWGRVRTAVQEALFSGLGDKIRELGAVYLPILESGLSKIGEAANGAMKRIADMLTEGKNSGSVDSILKNTATLVEHIGEALAPLASAFLDIADVGVKVLAEMTGGAGSLAQGFADWIRRAKESGQLEEWMRGGLNTIKEIFIWIKDLGEIFVNMFSSMGKGLTDSGVIESMTQAKDDLLAFTRSAEGKKFFENLGYEIGSFAKAIIWVTEKVAGLMVTMDNLRNNGFSLGPLLDWNAFGQGFVTFGNWLYELPAKIGGFFTTVGSWLTTPGTGLLGGFESGAQMGFVTFGNWLTELPGKIGGFFGGSDTWLSGPGSGLLGGLLGGLNAKVPEMGLWFSQLPGHIGSFFTNVWDWLNPSGKGLIGGLGSGAGSAFGDLGSWFDAVPGKIGKFFDDCGEWLRGPGRNIVEGLMQGIRDAAGWFQRGWNEFIESLPGDFLNFMKIGSPSRLMADIAQWIPAGIGVGIDANSDAALNPMRMLAEDLVSAAYVPAMGARLPTVGVSAIAPLIAAQGGAQGGAGAGTQTRVSTEARAGDAGFDYQLLAAAVADAMDGSRISFDSGSMEHGQIMAARQRGLR